VLIEGEKSPYLYTVLSGWLFKYKMLDDGRRQILNYALRGDLLGLQSAVLDKMQHSVEALTETTLCVFPKEKIWGLYKDHHALGFDLTWIAAQEKAILADFLVSVGQRTATERIAFLLLALYRRAQSVGLARRGQVQFPFSQEHFADTIGFSLVHTNKRLRLLKRSGAFEWSGPIFALLDEQRLVELAGDPCHMPVSRPFL
jgi:CRP-like cAMP-binding protein